MVRNTQKGFATYILILLMGVLAVMILSLISSRLILALQRGVSVSDNLVTGYKAESDMNDILVRLVHGPGTLTFPLSNVYQLNSLKVDIQGTEIDNKQTIDVTVSRPFAVNKLEAVRYTNTVAARTPDLEIMLILDCTTSMHQTSGAGEIKFIEERNAVNILLNTIKNSTYADRVKVGVEVFGTDPWWFIRADGSPLTPTKVTDEIVNEVIGEQYGLTLSSSCLADGGCRPNACRVVEDGTSIGGAFAFSHEYFNSHPPQSEIQRAEILITDGLPNAQIPLPLSSGSLTCPHNGLYSGPGICYSDHYPWNGCSLTGFTETFPYAKDFLRCVLADRTMTYSTDVSPSGNYSGVRDPGVLAFAITVLQDETEDFLQVKDIFNRYATGYYNVANASDLTSRLISVFNGIATRSSMITLQRIVPTQ